MMQDYAASKAVSGHLTTDKFMNYIEKRPEKGGILPYNGRA